MTGNLVTETSNLTQRNEIIYVKGMRKVESHTTYIFVRVYVLGCLFLFGPQVSPTYCQVMNKYVSLIWYHSPEKEGPCHEKDIISVYRRLQTRFKRVITDETLGNPSLVRRGNGVTTRRLLRNIRKGSIHISVHILYTQRMSPNRQHVLK